MRLDKLLYDFESQKAQRPILEIEIVENSEQVNHPERFKKVLDHEEITESRCKVRTYHFESKG